MAKKRPRLEVKGLNKRAFSGNLINPDTFVPVNRARNIDKTSGAIPQELLNLSKTFKNVGQTKTETLENLHELQGEVDAAELSAEQRLKMLSLSYADLEQQGLIPKGSSPTYYMSLQKNIAKAMVETDYPQMLEKERSSLEAWDASTNLPMSDPGDVADSIFADLGIHNAIIRAQIKPRINKIKRSYVASVNKNRGKNIAEEHKKVVTNNMFVHLNNLRASAEVSPTTLEPEAFNEITILADDGYRVSLESYGDSVLEALKASVAQGIENGEFEGTFELLDGVQSLKIGKSFFGASYQVEIQDMLSDLIEAEEEWEKDQIALQEDKRKDEIADAVALGRKIFEDILWIYEYDEEGNIISQKTANIRHNNGRVRLGRQMIINELRDDPELRDEALKRYDANITAWGHAAISPINDAQTYERLNELINTPSVPTQSIEKDILTSAGELTVGSLTTLLGDLKDRDTDISEFNTWNSKNKSIIQDTIPQARNLLRGIVSLPHSIESIRNKEIWKPLWGEAVSSAEDSFANFLVEEELFKWENRANRKALELIKEYRKDSELTSEERIDNVNNKLKEFLQLEIEKYKEALTGDQASELQISFEKQRTPFTDKKVKTRLEEPAEEPTEEPAKTNLEIDLENKEKEKETNDK